MVSVQPSVGPDKFIFVSICPVLYALTDLISSPQSFIFTTIWINGCSLGVAIVSITAKPYILQKNLFHRFCSKVPRIVTWALLFWTSDLMEAAKDQKHPCEAKKSKKELN